MFLGETEKNMARAFDEARSDDAILLIDEADSFLRDRTLAQRSWEVSICNEMLQQMEAFPGIVVMTTNLWDSLDAAVLRRFTIKVELRPMTAPHARALFWTMFGGFIGAVTDEETAAVDARLAKATLTPGDMRCVQRRQTLLADQSALGIAAEVVAESRVRDRGGRAIGFGGARPGLTAGPQPWSVP